MELTTPRALDQRTGTSPAFRLADLVCDALPLLGGMSDAQRFALHAITGCRTGSFGERVLQCVDCNHRLHCPRSCGHPP